jgi:hypothetical protein
MVPLAKLLRIRQGISKKYKNLWTKKILESPIGTIPWKRIERKRRNFTKNKILRIMT